MNTYTRTEALAVPCPNCHANKDEPCLGTRNQPRTALHSERYRAATDTPQREHRNYDNDTPKEPRPTWCQCQPDNGTLQLCDEHRRIGLEAIAQIKAARTNEEPRCA